MPFQLSNSAEKRLKARISLFPIEIETERLFIRPYQTKDFDNSANLYGDATITQYFDHGLPRSREEVKSLTEKGCHFFKLGQPLGLFTILLKETMNYMGHIDCLPAEEPGSLEIGYILHKQHQNKGFGTEAAKSFVFDFIPLINSQVYSHSFSRIIATVHPENISSKKVIEKIGMSFEKYENRFGHPRMKYYLDLKTATSNRHVWEAAAYHHHSSAQKEAAIQLLQYLQLKGDEQVLDAGCGDGKITAMIASLVLNGSVLGIDISLDMIKFAQNKFEQTIYSNLTFSTQDIQDLDYFQNFDLIFSSFALQWVAKHDSFFSGAYKSLKPSGCLVATIPLDISGALEQAIEEIKSLPEWSSYFKDFSPGWHFLNENQFRHLLDKHGFMPTRFKVIHQETTFPSRESFEKYVLQWFSYLKPLPDHLKSVFFDQIIGRYLELEEPSSKGEIYFNFSRLDIIAFKTGFKGF